MKAFIALLVACAAAPQQPIPFSASPWARAYAIPSLVVFSHKLHTAKGNTCQECHEPVNGHELQAQ